MFEKPPCDVCRALRKGKRRKKCSVCLPPLKEQNADAVKVYLLTRNQLIFAGMGEAVDINHVAVHGAIDRLKIRNGEECFLKVLRISDHMLGLQREKDDKNGLEAD